MTPTIENILQQFDSISLQEMESVKLMNRIDTKYVVPYSLLPQLLLAAQSAYYVQQIDGARMAHYDTVYYDTEDLDMYVRHHDRQLVRQKIRMRDYVDSNLVFLEIKRKNNKGRTKKKRIVISNPQEQASQINEFVAQKSRYVWTDLSPRLQTLFTRITLVNKQKTERLTIDLNLRFVNVRTNTQEHIDGMVIVELKRDGNMPSRMTQIMQQLRIKPLKVSKYCIGTALTNPLIKQNRFKQKIRKINKTIHTS